MSNARNEYFSSSIYLDSKKRTILIIPLARNEIGIWSQANFPQMIEWRGENFRELGEKALEAFRVSQTHPVIMRADAVKVYTQATGIKGWAPFAKRHQMISACMYPCDPERRYKFEFWRRRSDNSFGNDAGETVPLRELPPSAAEEALGRAIIDVYTQAGVL